MIGRIGDILASLPLADIEDVLHFAAFAVFAAIIGIVRWVQKKAEEARRQRALNEARRRPEQVGQQQDDDDWIQVRQQPGAPRPAQQRGPLPLPSNQRIPPSGRTSARDTAAPPPHAARRTRRKPSVPRSKAPAEPVSGRRDTSESAPGLADLKLDEPAAARKAILYQEILGPPKALREQGGRWDR